MLVVVLFKAVMNLTIFWLVFKVVTACAYLRSSSSLFQYKLPEQYKLKAASLCFLLTKGTVSRPDPDDLKCLEVHTAEIRNVF